MCELAIFGRQEVLQATEVGKQCDAATMTIGTSQNTIQRKQLLDREMHRSWQVPTITRPNRFRQVPRYPIYIISSQCRSWSSSSIAAEIIYLGVQP